jgi:hypothetical protein
MDASSRCARMLCLAFYVHHVLERDYHVIITFLSGLHFSVAPATYTAFVAFLETYPFTSLRLIYY